MSGVTTTSAGAATGTRPPSEGDRSASSMIRRPAEAVRTLATLCSERSVAEARVSIERKDRTELAERSYLDARRDANTRKEEETASADAAQQARRAAAVARAQSERDAATKAHEAAVRKAKSRHAIQVGDVKKSTEDAKWEAQTIFDAARVENKQRLEIHSRNLAIQAESFAAVREGAESVFALHQRFAPPATEAPAPVIGEGEPPPIEVLAERIAQADLSLVTLERLALPKVLRIDRYIAWVVFISALLAGAGFLAAGWPIGVIAGVVAGIVLGVALRGWLVSLAKRQVACYYHPLRQSLAEIDEQIQRSRSVAEAAFSQQETAVRARRDEGVAKADKTRASVQFEADVRRDAELKKLESDQAATLEAIEKRRVAELKTADEEHAAAIAGLTRRHEDALGQADRHYEHVRRTTLAAHDRDWQAMADRWRKGFGRVQAEAAALERETGQFSFDWDGPEGAGDWMPVDEVPPAVRVGEFRIPLSQVPGGPPKDDKLKAEVPQAIVVPALVPFPELGCLMLKASGPGRDVATHTLQAVMLRLLTAVPPGKLRYTIVDPVGLGRNFAAFMHLADFEEALVSSRIWTEPHHIERKLTDLTEVMENVIQKYLRNEYKTIQEYNAQAGEVAEPYRILIIADFPHNFTESAARRLASIIESGARCGVSVLMSVDTTAPLPSGIKLADLERHATVIHWQNSQFAWRGEPLASYTLTLDEPPSPDRATEVLKAVGAAAKKALRVEVPFEVIAPPEGQWWKGSAQGGIDVPLGRAGANRLQHLSLGKGTSQHVLIAGRTGSGKSTLLHALITNLALTYSPEEVELYLIDFKKGVEFKTYAAHELPHARVIAVESEREFGLSVLQRLDAAMKERGDLFRAVGAQDVSSYRRLAPGSPLPRLLLIIDEFQEFFVEDDRVAQDCALLLDRLVRQGRAFGIHLHMGSQTLAGAYSLARSTIGQMGVRIALQCSESDAHLILSEDNAAARLLSRPGEAIYNDANGMVEGNHIFQVVWLNDDRREDYLNRIHDLARERGLLPKQPAIVFEGNIPADVSRNGPLLNLLDAPSWPEPERAPRAWLGEAVAIKDPTAAVFRPQGGSHLLIVGQNEDASLSMILSGVVGLAAQRPPGTARFYLGDGSPVDALRAGTLAKLADVLPHPVSTFGPRNLNAPINEVAQEIERRQGLEGQAPEDIYLVLYDLARFRDLRKSEDDFGGSFGKFGGFGSSESAPPPPSPSKQFGTILREGPALGVHVIVWCDTLNNLNRTLERADLREFEMRVLFQMSQADSSNLIDTPVASRLGFHRAYFHSEEQGTLEKFRPYGLPDDAWFAEVGTKLRRRAKISIQNGGLVAGEFAPSEGASS